MPAAADVYRWVDERGVTHYSDQRPTDPHAAARVERVRGGRISVYSTDRPLAQVVDAPNAGPAPYLAATSTPSPATFDPCLAADCAVSGVLQPYPATFVPVHRRAPQLQQAILPPGAIAGTLNANGAIPGNSAALSPVIPEAIPRGPRERPVRARPAGVVPHPR